VKIFEIPLHNHPGNLTLDGKRWFEEISVRISKGIILFVTNQCLDFEVPRVPKVNIYRLNQYVL
jgi:hypothetical protein